MAVPVRRLAVGLAAVMATATACGPVASLEFDTVQPSDVSRASIVAFPTPGTTKAGMPKKVDPSERIVVTAQDGQLAEVVVTGPRGKQLKGELSEDGTIWTASRRTLAFGASYQIEATAVDPRGVAVTHTDGFVTLEPKDFFRASVTPAADETVGVGMPITVSFDKPVLDKAAVEQAMTVYTPTPLEGAWAWSGDQTVQFRPRDYWPGNIDVTVAVDLKGVQGADGVYGKGRKSSTFHVGPSMVTKVNAATHTAQVFRDGERIRSIPITTGKAGFETRSGIKLILSKERSRVMDAASGGTSSDDPEYYRVTAPYAMRVTYSGEFLHGAPWSVGSQGFANVSHGCIGMSESNAAWLFDLSSIGDVVEVTGTDNPQNLGNGITVWNETWDQWLVKSAVGAITTTTATPPPVDPLT